MNKFEDYFNDWEVREDYKEEFVSLWSGWLGKENYHKLDSVSEEDWSKFNHLIRLISEKYNMLLVDFPNKKLKEIRNIEETLSDYEESMNKSREDFSYYVIPELNCIIGEDWDYTYIIWYKKNIIEKLENLIKEAGLYHFS